MTSVTLDRIILALYNLCGLALVAVAKTGIVPGYIPIWLRIITGVLFAALIVAHIWRSSLRKKNNNQH